MSIIFMGSGRSEIWRQILVLLIGQLLSLCIAAVSFTSSYIADLGVKTPLAQSLITYLFLAVVYGGIFQYRRQKLLVAWYWYVILAIADVHGNYLCNYFVQHIIHGFSKDSGFNVLICY